MIWYIWEGPKSPVFGKDKMATFERYFVEDKETHTETKNSYYRLLDNEEIITKILMEFGLDSKNSHIVNGHVPVELKKGESPIKCGGIGYFFRFRDFGNKQVQNQRGRHGRRHGNKGNDSSTGSVAAGLSGWNDYRKIGGGFPLFFEKAIIGWYSRWCRFRQHRQQHRIHRRRCHPLHSLLHFRHHQ